MVATTTQYIVIQYSSGHTISLNSNNPYYKTTNREQVPELTVQVIVVSIQCSSFIKGIDPLRMERSCNFMWRVQSFIFLSYSYCSNTYNDYGGKLNYYRVLPVQ